jgi:site-specific DNA-methyltransferase (adenine-specific)
MNFIQGDIHKVITTLADNSYDLIYTNPPFGTTENEWDVSLDWNTLFKECFRVLKPNGALVIHCSIPFTYDLIRIEKPRYHYVWIKDHATCFYLAKRQPLRKHEEVLVYYKHQPTYNPQMVGDEWIPSKVCKNKNAYYGNRSKDKPKDEGHRGRYPTTVLEYPRHVRGFSTRPDEMMEFFVKTYSNEGEKVLDMTCHNGVCGRVCKRLGRIYTGVDIRMHKDWVTAP